MAEVAQAGRRPAADPQSRRRRRTRRDRYWRYRHLYGNHGSPRTLAIAIAIACLALLVGAVWRLYTAPPGEDRPGLLGLCHGPSHGTCLIDGDTGRDNGKKWRLISIDAPELAEPACENERRLAIASRDRLRQLLAGGYRIRPSGRDDPHGRALVDILLPDGRDVGRVLLDEGLAQKWPNRGNPWCADRAAAPGGPPTR